jgi:hypothetical protein
LILRLADRVEELTSLYANFTAHEPKGELYSWEDRRALAEEMEAVNLVEDQTRWLKLRSYSARQKQFMPIDGFIGPATFAGPIGGVRELLAWGEILHIGRNATKGNGAYRLVTAH